eukprot:TRINITY_DN2297_c0_g1_i2.p1 TRINITY_DN2297_c0_g1~~TRINITY_DN2297_c0_g1_i2.p1  ORF type:complete len:297 (+),score=57.54 TRINITY_DN2297_c0_g1_i2:35-892(+)
MTIPVCDSPEEFISSEPMSSSAVDLPFEALVFILSRLDTKTLLSASRVCKRWNEASKEKRIHGVVFLRELLDGKNVTLPDFMIHQIYKLKKFNIPESLELLLEYSHFRRAEFSRFPDPDAVIRSEAESRVAFWMGTDSVGRPVILVRPRLHLPQKKNPTLLFALDLFEQACEIVYRKSGISELVVVLDFEGFSTQNFDLTFARTFVSWSRKYFKNLLGASYSIRSPSYALVCWRIVRVFIPAVTLKKIFILKPHEWQPFMLKHFDPSQLPRVYGGNSAKLDKLVV